MNGNHQWDTESDTKAMDDYLAGFDARREAEQDVPEVQVEREVCHCGGFIVASRDDQGEYTNEYECASCRLIYIELDARQ